MKKILKSKKKQNKLSARYMAHEIDNQYMQKEREKEEKHIFNEPLLTSDFEENFTTNEPVRELTTGKNIKFKTEVTIEERSMISILYNTYFQFKNIWGIELSSLKGVLNEWVDFGASVERKSRDEFVKAHQLTNAQNQSTSKPIGQANELKTG